MTPETLTRIEALVTKWREDANHQDAIIASERARGIHSGCNEFAFLKARRIYTECANELNAALDAQRPETAGTMPTKTCGTCFYADGSIREMLGLSCTNVSSIGYGKYVHEDNGCIKGWVGRREGNQS